MSSGNQDAADTAINAGSNIATDLAAAYEHLLTTLERCGMLNVAAQRHNAQRAGSPLEFITGVSDWTYELVGRHRDALHRVSARHPDLFIELQKSLGLR